MRPWELGSVPYEQAAAIVPRSNGPAAGLVRVGDEGGAKQERQVLGEALARPVAVVDQRLDHVGGDEREEHVAGRLGGPCGGEPALVMEAVPGCGCLRARARR